MKKKQVIPQNYLENVPVRNPAIRWTTDDSHLVTLEIDNKGPFNRIAQLLLKKPKVTYIHLDANGSFVWPLIDGEASILTIAEAVDKQFGEAAHPLYERLAQFFKVLESYRFVSMKE